MLINNFNNSLKSLSRLLFYFIFPRLACLTIILIFIINSPLLVYGAQFGLSHKTFDRVDSIFGYNDVPFNHVGRFFVKDSIYVRSKFSFSFSQNAKLISFLVLPNSKIVSNNSGHSDKKELTDGSQRKEARFSFYYMFRQFIILIISFLAGFAFGRLKLYIRKIGTLKKAKCDLEAIIVDLKSNEKANPRGKDDK